MRYFVPFAVLAVGLVFSPIARADDNELFSEVAMEFVYATGDQTKSTTTITTKQGTLPTRVTGASTLITLLQSAGYQPTKVDGRSVMVKMRSAGWNLQANIRSDVQADRLTIDMPLAKIADESAVDQAKLLRLLSVGKGENKVFFAYDGAEGTIDLRRVMSNRGLTGQLIEQELSDMAKVAQANEEDWSDIEKSTKTTAKTDAAPRSNRQPTTPATSQPRSNTANSNLTLVGTWSAVLGAGEAFAIQINRDTTFRLVHVKAGKSVSSTGTAARRGNQLTLNGDDGTKIVGTYTQTTAEAFQLSVSAATLKFKKAK